MIFRYKSGELVLEGDAVTLAGRIAYVGAVIQPGTQTAIDYSCNETGGVFITDALSIRPGWVLLPSTESAEDLLFVGRNEVS